VELRAVEELAEDLRDLRLDDAGAVVLDRDAEAVLGEELDLDTDRREDPGLLARVQRVVDRLLDGGQECLLGIVEPQQVAVLGEELGNGDLALARCQALGGLYGNESPP